MNQQTNQLGAIMIDLREYRQRRARVLEAMKQQPYGDSAQAGVAVLQGAPKEKAHDRFRQSNDVMYLCPIETPHAYLVLDGRDESTHLFLPFQSDVNRAREGALLSASDPAEAMRATGVDGVHSIDHLMPYLQGVQDLSTPMRAGEGASQSWDTLQRAFAEQIADPWDGQADRVRRFISLIRERVPGATVTDLSPVVDRLRLVKSGSEIELLRRAGKLSAQGLREAMRATRPGMHEYQLDAVMRYVYLNNGARDVSYRAIVASGANAWYGHYKANDAVMNDGDLLLVDCGPDYRYYASDSTRMWPVNGVYDKVQRQLYGFMVDYHRTLLGLLRPGVTAQQVQREAADEMRVVIERTDFVASHYKQAAERALDFPVHLSHSVGMAVHDVGQYRGQVLRPGVVISVDPQLIIPEERRYVRVEDTVVVTNDGIENLTSDAPLELDDVESTMKEAGMPQRFPPLWKD